MAQNSTEAGLLKGILDSSRNLEAYSNSIMKTVEESTQKISVAISGATTALSSINKKLDKIINLMGQVSGDGFLSSLKTDNIAELSKLNTSILQNVAAKLEKFIKEQQESASGKGKNAKDGAEAIKTVSGSFGDLIKGLTLFSAVPGTRKFITFIRNLGQVFEEIDAEKVKKGAEGVKALGAAIFTFGLSLAASSVLYVLGLPGAIISATVITGLSVIFERIDGDKLAKAGMGITMMAGGIAILGLSLWAFQKLNIEYETGLKVMLITAGLSLVFGIAGKFAGNIALGAVAVGLTGISIAAVSLGLMAFKKTNFTYGDIGVLSGTLVAIGGVFALAGIPFIAGFIALGAIALGFASLALIGISIGLQKFKAAKIDEETSDQLSYGINAIASSFGNIGIIQSAKMILGAGAVMIAGKAVSSVSSAMKSWLGINFTEQDGLRLISAVGSISAAFAQAGGAEGTSGSVLKFLTGVDLSPNNVERGISSVLKSGQAMQSVVEGIKAFNSLSSIGLSEDAFMLDDNGRPIQGTLLGNIYSILTAIKGPFAEIGQSANSSSSLIKGIFGADFAESDVEQGIEAVMSSGEALKSVVEGIKAFNTLSSLGLSQDAFTLDADGKPIQGSLLGNIYSILTAVKSVFGQIGQSANSGGSLIKGIFGADFGESDVEQGIEAVQGTGLTLKSLAEGLKSFSDLTKMGLSKDAFDENVQGSLIWNIKAVLTSVKEVFAKIGQSANSGGSLIKGIFGGDFAESDVEQGIDSVKGTGEVLKNIAEGVMVFAGKDFNANQAVKNIETIILSVPNIFAKLKIKGDLKKDPKVVFLNTFVFNMERLAKIEKPLEKIAGSINKMGTGLGKFGSFFKEFKPELFKSFADFTNSLVSFSSVKNVELERNANSSGTLIKSAADYVRNNQTSSSNTTNNTTALSAMAPQVRPNAISKEDPRLSLLKEQNEVLQRTMIELIESNKTMSATLVQIKNRLDGTINTRDVKI